MSSEAVSPIDGRYWNDAKDLSPYFSESAVFQARLKVELSYLGLLIRLGIAPKAEVPRIPFEYNRIKKLEEALGHDVKAVEVYIRGQLDRKSKSLAPFVHLGLTSEDTNSLAYAKLIAGSMDAVLVPEYSGLALDLAELAVKEARTSMLARTHGRPAVPTTLGKEMAVFAVRIAERTSKLANLRPMAKFSGAVGTYASFNLLGKQDWPRVLSDFVSGMGVDFAAYSTQVVPGERLSDILHSVANLNQLIVSLARDLWLYQTLGYLRFQRGSKVSSSTMPQKVNPVDLENAEGQAELSNAILVFLEYRLQMTRMQRDLSDSVLRRMVGQGLAHSLVASRRLRASLASMVVDRNVMREDLRSHPEVFAEAAQISLRLSGDERGYEKTRAAVDAGRFVASPKHSRRGYTGEAARLALECKNVVVGLLNSRT